MAAVPAPYLDIAGFTARTVMPSSDVAVVTKAQSAWFAAKEAQVRAGLNSRLRKRYTVPFGSTAAPLSATGTNPPTPVLSGAPSLGSMAVVLAIVSAGALGASSFEWSSDGGNTWTIGASLAGSGTTPPAVSVGGNSALKAPSALVVQVTVGGTLGAAGFQWSGDGGATWTANPVLAASGTTPPAVTIAGLSTLPLITSLQIQITGAGALGTALFRWSLNGGTTWSSGVTASSVPLPGTGLTVTFPPGVYATNNVYLGQGIATAASVGLGATGLALSFAAGTYATNNVYLGQGIATAASVGLPGTGLTVTFPAGTYGADNVFSAETPVQETVLAWMTAILTPDVYRKRGVDPSDPQLTLLEADRTRAFAEIKEAADSETGLFDLPLLESTGTSAVSRGGPLFYTETSPYVSADMQARIGSVEDGCSQ